MRTFILSSKFVILYPLLWSPILPVNSYSLIFMWLKVSNQKVITRCHGPHRICTPSTQTPQPPPMTVRFRWLQLILQNPPLVPQAEPNINSLLSLLPSCIIGFWIFTSGKRLGYRQEMSLVNEAASDMFIFVMVIRNRNKGHKNG